MTPKNTTDPEENPLGVLDDAASVDTAVIGILGGTAQVSVALPSDGDDDLDDDGVVDGEVVGDLVVDDARVVADPTPIAASPSTRTKPGIVIGPIVIDEPAPVSPVTPVSGGAEGAASDEIVHDAELEPEPDLRPESAPDETEPAPPADAPASAAQRPSAAQTASAARAEEATHAEEAKAAAQFLAQASADPVAAAVGSAAVRRPAVKETEPVSSPDEKSVVAQPTRASARTDVTLTSKRLDELGESSRESADLLTADRLLDPHRLSKPEPEGAWSHFLYTVSGRRINIGDGRRARERKALTTRIAAPLTGGARFVPVLSRKGGVGKTTITALLGMALADARDDRVIAVDANPDRGTLAERIVRPHHNKSVRDLVRIHDDVRGYHDISAIVARDATRLDVLASDADPRIAEAFSDSDYRDVAGVAAHYYSLVLTDTGTGIVHSVMSATLDLADQIVIVSGLSVDEARLASETLTWLETNGYAEQAREAIVVLNQSTPGAPLVRLNELQTHFATRAKSVIRMPYDPQIAGGGTIVFANLLPETRVAARQLAALLVEGLRAKAA